MAYDSAHGFSVLFALDVAPGGPSTMQTWLWGGSSWLRCVPQIQPPQRVEHAMTYDASRGVVVLFGGQYSTALGDTWEWDGSNWALRSTSGPSPRLSCAMAYDHARGVVVLFGGTPLAGLPNGDTWEWDGQVWTQRATSGPSARTGPGMTYDAERSVVLLYGGLAAGNVLDDLWEWDGNQWTERIADPKPPGRVGPGFLFDSKRKVSVLFGGNVTGGTDYAVVWEWDGGSWYQRPSNVTPGPDSNNSLMVYDSRRSKCVFVRRTPADTWEYPTNSPVAIVNHPVGRKVCLGESISMAVEAVGNGPFTYQWKKNGSVYNAPDATMQSIHINSADFGSAGEYEVVVSNGCSQETSACATISVCPGPAGCPSPVDVNGDGAVNGLDLQRIVEVLLGG